MSCPSAPQMYPKALGSMVAGMLLVNLGVVCERWVRLSNIASEAERSGVRFLLGREGLIPNYRHVWNAHDMVFRHGQGMPMDKFGKDFQRLSGQWPRLCKVDSDRDGFTNGEELGDPCCLWTPNGSAVGGSSSTFRRQGEYRRWGLSHPASRRSNQTADFPGLSMTPQTCDNYDNNVHAQQFRAFYFRKADGAFEPVPLVAVKVVSFGVLLAQLVFWAWKRSLCRDVAPWLSKQPNITTGTSLVVPLLAFVYMDLTSGVVHLILDYAPHWLPVIGGLAKGFQYHHHDPTAIIRISWYAYVSHVHLLCPVVAALLLFSDASRVHRLFWFWGSVFVHLFQTTHRWAHFPPEQLPWVVRLLQDSRLLLTHERHMHHHEDLEKQFTILSGHTDFLLDSASALVPPCRYDIWLFIGIGWFLLPIALDVKLRPFFEAIEFRKRKMVLSDSEGIALKDFNL